MMLETAGVSEPRKQKGRPGTGRPFTNFINSNNIVDSTHALRIQRLRLIGIDGHRANMIASLAWGETVNG